MYDKSDVGLAMRSWLTVTLGTWHPYKQATQVVWKHWSKRVFAPLFHDLIPNANFNPNAKLATVATFFTYVRLAYPHFKDQLTAARTECKSKDDRIGVSNLSDLMRLLEFFLPVVKF